MKKIGYEGIHPCGGTVDFMEASKQYQFVKVGPLSILSVQVVVFILLR